MEAGDIPDVSGGTFWLVDPLDGTKELINKRRFHRKHWLDPGWCAGDRGGAYAGEWACLGGSVGDGAWEETADGNRTPIQVRAAGPDGLVIVASRSHHPELETFIETLKVKDSVSRGSALKFCLVARRG